MAGRVIIFLGIVLFDLASCGSRTARSEKVDCPDRMYRYVSPWSGWSACLPVAVDLVIDTSDTDPFNTGRSEIQGAPMAFSERSRAKALKEYNAWIRSGKIGEEPIDPADTTIATRSFYMYSFPLDSFKTEYDIIGQKQILYEQKQDMEKYLAWKKTSDPDESWPNTQVTTIVNSNNKDFIKIMQWGIFNNPEQNSFVVAELTFKHFGNDRSFTFSGLLQLRDTTCGLECMEKDTTILLYNRIVDSVDW